MENTFHTQIYQSKSGYNYTFLFAFEKKFFNETLAQEKMQFVSEYFYNSLIYAFIYLVILFGSQNLMKNREKFNLKHSLIAWNFVLAGFSTLGAIRIWPEFIYVLKTKGLRHSYCSKDWLFGVTGGWGALFVVSKLPELADTFFIVARKQKLIFLHWYHHFTVLIYAVFSAKDFAASGRWFCIMNFTVHAFMYTYYAFRALRFKIPKWINILITTSQLLQMVFGVYINVNAYLIRGRGEYCDISYDNMRWSFLMYFTYFVLFFNFFYKTYIATPKKQSDLSKKENLNKKMH